MVHADNLVALHQSSGKGLRGKRHREISLNRAVVVTAVATWQAAVQDLVTAILDSGNQVPQSDPKWGLHNLLAGNVRNDVNKFSTPNAQNSERLLQHAGFNPAPHWTWPRHSARPAGTAYSQSYIKQRLDEWVSVRHAIAHGHDDLPSVQALQVVRNPHLAPRSGNPTLRLEDAKDCVAFFHNLVSRTGNGVASHLGLSYPSWERPQN
ncbi:HEPN domain-containing protein [Brachybacterium paraconglomeratum]|uniref:HEPN domain-containing protein n=1 Tax=Brachybacterium paraconglomeratum TaxID=173362 RepID=UPI00351744F8